MDEWRIIECGVRIWGKIKDVYKAYQTWWNIHNFLKILQDPRLLQQ